ncbi:MAG: DUF945 family protein [Pseudomonadota bacterium]
MKKPLIAVAVLGLAYIAAAWGTGILVQRQLDRELGKLPALLPAVKITEDQHTRGLFGSTRLTRFDLASAFDHSSCPVLADESAPAMAPPTAAPLTVSLKQTITHGPLPGFGWPGAASIRYDWLVNGQPPGTLGNAYFSMQLQGAMPALVAHHGFTGNSRLRLEGDAGQLTISDPQRKGSVTFAWPALRFSARSRADLSASAYTAALPALTVTLQGEEGEPLTLLLKDLALSASHEYPNPGFVFFYTGSDVLKLGSLSVQQGGRTLFEASAVQAQASSREQGGLIESSTRIGLASAVLGGDTVGPVQADFTLANVDAAAYGELLRSLFDSDLGRCPTLEQSTNRMVTLQQLLPTLLARAPTFRIDRISLGYQGAAATLRGELTLPVASAGPLTDPMALLAMASGHLALALPDKLLEKLAVKALGSSMAMEMTLGEGTPAPTPAQQSEAEALARSVLAQQVEQALTRRWIVRDKDGIAARLDYRSGEVLLNGAPPDLGSIGMGAAALPALPRLPPPP